MKLPRITMPIYISTGKEARELLKAGFKPVLKFKNPQGTYYQFNDNDKLKEFIWTMKKK